MNDATKYSILFLIGCNRNWKLISSQSDGGKGSQTYRLRNTGFKNIDFASTQILQQNSFNTFKEQIGKKDDHLPYSTSSLENIDICSFSLLAFVLYSPSSIPNGTRTKIRRSKILRKTSPIRMGEWWVVLIILAIIPEIFPKEAVQAELTARL